MRVVEISKSYCKAYLVIDRGNGILIDTLCPGSERFILNKIKEIGIYTFEPKAIFITHAHFDHAGSAATLASFLHIPIISHSLSASYLKKGENAPVSPYGAKGRVVFLGMRFVNTKYKPFSPDVIFNGITTLDEFGIDGYLIHTPGHTACSSTLEINKKAAFIGDLLMGAPFSLGGPSYPVSVTSIKELYKSIEKLLTTDVKRFYPGHGRPWEAGEVKAFLNRCKKREGELAFVN